MTTETQAPDPAPDHLELFKEAGEWAETMKRKLTPDMIELLGWLTGAAQAWAEKVEAQAAIQAPEGAPLTLPPPDTHCWDDDTGKDVWSYSADLVRSIVSAALAAPAPQAPAEIEAKADNDSAYAYADGWNACRRAMLAAAPAPTDAELERRTGEPHVDGWPLVSGLPAPQGSLDSAQPSKGVAMQAPAEAHGDEREAFETWAESCDLPLDESLSGIPGSGPLYVNAETVMAWEGWNARAALNVQPKGIVEVPAGMARSDAEFWLRKRGELLSALAAHGLTMVTTVNGVQLMRLGKIEAQSATQAPAPVPGAASAPRPFDAVKSFADSVLAMLDERIKTVDRAAHPFNDYFGDKPETIVAAKAQASELREVRTQARILGDRALVDLMKFRPAISAPAVGADTARLDWLENVAHTVTDCIEVDSSQRWSITTATGVSVGRSLRAAIDTDMAAASRVPVQGKAE